MIEDQRVAAADLLACLPHRPPFLWVDAVVVDVAAKMARGTRLFAAGDPGFAGHFPGEPILPGVIVVEALGQTGGVLLAQTEAGRLPTPVRGRLAKVDVRFHESVRPGDTLTMEVRLGAQINNMFELLCKATTHCGPIASGRVLVARTQ